MRTAPLEERQENGFYQLFENALAAADASKHIKNEHIQQGTNLYSDCSYDQDEP